MGSVPDVSIPEGAVTAVVLGNIQDGGLPHIGCHCTNCLSVLNAGDDDNGIVAPYVACLAIVDRRSSDTRVWLIDATPDIKYQLELLAQVLGPHPDHPGRIRQVDGIFLTHAHLGHVGGLPELGPEAMAVTDLPVYASAGMVKLLTETHMWRPTVQNLRLTTIMSYESLSLAPALSVTAVPVPHRDEWGIGTFAFRIEGPKNALLYLPDIDAWEEWHSAREQLSTVDFALVDACFYSMDELGGQPPIAHPLVPRTLHFFADLPCQLVLTHLNHTNPLLASNSLQHAVVSNAGAIVAQTGQAFNL